MVHDEAPCALQESNGAHAVTQHAEDASALAVRDSVEALQDTCDITVVLLHHRVAVFLRIRLYRAIRQRQRW